MANEALELLVEAVGLDLEGVDRIGLGVPAQVDAAAQIVQLGEVLDPQGVDRAQQDEPLDERPVVLTHVGLAGAQLPIHDVVELGPDRLVAAQLGQALLRDVVLGQADGDDRPGQIVERGLAGVVGPDVRVEERVDLLFEEGPHRVGEVLVAQDLVALAVNRLALLVDHVVQLDDALAHVEVEALDARLGALDRLRNETRLDGHVLLDAEALHETRDTVRGEALHEVVVERQVEA